MLLNMLMKLLLAEPGLHEEEVDLPEGTEQPELPERLPEPPMLAELLLG